MKKTPFLATVLLALAACAPVAHAALTNRSYTAATQVVAVSAKVEIYVGMQEQK